MRLKSRSYNSKIFRPKPVIFQEEELNLIILATPWGDQDIAKRAVDEIYKYIQAVEVDIEVTTPFESLKSLPDTTNHLRIALQLANQNIYRSENEQKINTGLEVVVMMVKGGQFFWAQVGCPQIFVKKDQECPLQMLSGPFDLNFELGHSNAAPLPGHLMGLDRDCNIQCGSCRIRSTDRVYLISASFVSEVGYKLIGSKSELDEITKILVDDNSEMPLWLGTIDIL